MLRHCYSLLDTVYTLYIYAWGGRHGCDRMVVGFTTTYAISAYHHWCCEFESRSGWSIQHYLIKFAVTCGRSVVFSGLKCNCICWTEYLTAFNIFQNYNVSGLKGYSINIIKINMSHFVFLMCIFYCKNIIYAVLYMTLACIIWFYLLIVISPWYWYYKNNWFDLIIFYVIN